MYKFFTTPRHGYLCVPMVDYKASGYKASKYSFSGANPILGMWNKMVYLEEDCDARGFMIAADVSLDDIEEVVLNYDIPDMTNVTPMSGEGFDISRSYPSRAST
jgi:hypothetical protein